MTIVIRAGRTSRPAARRRLLALLPALAVLSLPARAAEPLTEETAAAMGSFLQICARLLGGGDSAAAAREAGFVPVPPARAAALLRGAPGEVLTARGASAGTIALVLVARPPACSMRLQRMDVETAEALFARLAEGAVRPGLTLRREYDGTVPVPNARPARQLTYRLSSGRAGRPDFALAFTGAADPAAGTQGVLTIAAIAPRP